MAKQVSKARKSSSRMEKINPNLVNVNGITASTSPEIWIFTGTNKLYKTVAVQEFEVSQRDEVAAAKALTESVTNAIASVLPQGNGVDLSTQASRLKLADTILQTVLKQTSNHARAAVGFINASEVYAMLMGNSKMGNSKPVSGPES
jgi:hypothetical protein